MRAEFDALYPAPSPESEAAPAADRPEATAGRDPLLLAVFRDEVDPTPAAEGSGRHQHRAEGLTRQDYVLVDADMLKMIDLGQKLRLVDPPAIHGLDVIWAERIRNLSDEPGRHTVDDVHGEPMA